MKTLLPPGWPRPKGYANGVSAQGRAIFTAGVIGWDAQERFPAADLAGQFRQVLKNIVAILAEDEAGPQHVVRMTCYVVSRDEYVESLPAIGAAWREVMGRNFPTMAVVEVSALVEAQARVEIEATAMVPE